MKLRLPFLVISRKRYSDALADAARESYSAGYNACRDMVNEARKGSAKVALKSRKPRP